jgi:hypothetical protein
LIVSGGGQLIATADAAGAAGDAVTISIGGKPCGTIAGKNVTDVKLAGCGSLAVGTNVTLDLELTGGAMLYTVGFV